MAQAELLWALLKDGELEDLKRLNLKGLDWNSLHPVDGTTLVVKAVQSGMHSKQQEEGLKKIEWLISQGASISQKCTGGSWSVFKTYDKEATRITVECEDISAISFVEAWRGKLKRIDLWERQYNYLGRVWKIFAGSSRSRSSCPCNP